jgi:hypothetical protein
MQIGALFCLLLLCESLRGLCVSAVKKGEPLVVKNSYAFDVAWVETILRERLRHSVK